MPKKIAILLTHGFDDHEYLSMLEALQYANHRCIHIGQTVGNSVYGLNAQTKVTIDQSLENIHSHDFDALVIPGGQSPIVLTQNLSAIKLIQHFVQEQKIIMSLGSASLLLLKANVLSQRLITTSRPFAAAVSNAGAYYYDAELVNDKNQIISCRGVQDLKVFIPECLDILGRLCFYPMQRDLISHSLYVH